MIKKGFITLSVLLIILLWSCSPSSSSVKLEQWMQPNGKVKILCTISMIEDIVKQIGGQYVDTITLVQGELDPHTYQLVKGDDEKLAFAQLIFYNGLGLEHGPSLREYLAESKKTIGLGDRIKQNGSHLILHYNGSLDPHIWMDMELWSKTIPFIVEVLSKHDSENADFYKKNGENLTSELHRVHKELINEMHKVSEHIRFLVTSHDAFNYFARAYLATPEEQKRNEWQKRFAAPEGLSPESQLSTTDIRLILDHMKKYNIKVIFPESNVSQASIRKLVDAGQEKGMDLKIAGDYLYGDAMGAPGSEGDTYVKMLQHNVSTIARNLLEGNELP